MTYGRIYFGLQLQNECLWWLGRRGCGQSAESWDHIFNPMQKERERAPTEARHGDTTIKTHPRGSTFFPKDSITYSNSNNPTTCGPSVQITEHRKHIPPSNHHRHEEIGQQGRALWSCTQPEFGSQVHSSSQPCTIPVPVYPTPSPGLQGHCPHTVHIPTHNQSTHTCKQLNKSFKSKCWYIILIEVSPYLH